MTTSAKHSDSKKCPSQDVDATHVKFPLTYVTKKIASNKKKSLDGAQYSNIYTMVDPQTYTTKFSFQLKPVILEGSHLRLEPLSESHMEELVSLFDPEIWRWYTDQINTPDALRVFLQGILNEQTSGKTLAFAIREQESGQLIGSSRFMNISPAHRKLEIGSTWYGRNWQRTFANTEAKFLMLSHAFDSLSCISVQFQTDVLNARSRKAIERLGAKLEGVHRNDRICSDGRIRSSVYYSITDSEWPEVKQRLFARLIA